MTNMSNKNRPKFNHLNILQISIQKTQKIIRDCAKKYPRKLSKYNKTNNYQ